MFYDTSVYRGRYVTQCNQVIPDTFLRLTTGFDDVTITVTWAPVNADSSEAIAAAKTAAKADLAAELAKYKPSDANYNNIKDAHDDGVKAINKASTLAAITKAKALRPERDAHSRQRRLHRRGHQGLVPGRPLRRR